MVSVCTVPARGGRSCEHFDGYKTMNRIPLYRTYCAYSTVSMVCGSVGLTIRDGRGGANNMVS